MGMQWTMYSGQCTVYSVQCTVYSVQFTMSAVVGTIECQAVFSAAEDLSLLMQGINCNVQNPERTDCKPEGLENQWTVDNAQLTR
jgi:hypothetical protein